MYKTIRHGDNSLQYTILPQHDGGVDDKQISTRHCRKRNILFYIFAFLMLLTILGVLVTSFKFSIIQLIDHHLKFYERNSKSTTALKQNSLPEHFVSHIDTDEYDANGVLNAFKLKIQNQPQFSTTTQPVVTSTFTSSTKRKLSKLSWKWNNQAFTTADLNSDSKLAAVVPTTTTSKVVTPFKTTVATITSSSASSAMLALSTNSLDKSNQTWIKSYWPFDDLSTYFQWTVRPKNVIVYTILIRFPLSQNYKSEEHILLPIIFCGTITVIIMLIILCFIVRSKRCCCCCCRTRGKNEFSVIIQHAEYQ